MKKQLLIVLCLWSSWLYSQSIDIKMGLGIATAHTPKAYHPYSPKFHYYNAICVGVNLTEWLKLQAETGILNTGFSSKHPNFSINQIKSSLETGFESILLKGKFKVSLHFFYNIALPLYFNENNRSFYKFKAKERVIPIRNNDLGLTSQMSLLINEKPKFSWYVFVRCSYGLSSVYFNTPYSNSMLNYAWTRNVNLSVGLLFSLNKQNYHSSRTCQ